MDLVQHIMDTILIFSLALTEVLAQRSIINKDRFDVNGTFFLECDMDKFNVFSKHRSIVELAIERKLFGQFHYELMAKSILFPTSVSEQKQLYIPSGRQWNVEFYGIWDRDNFDTIKVTIDVRDASCEDVGEYRCYYLHSESLDFYHTKEFPLTLNQPITNHIITLEPRNSNNTNVNSAIFEVGRNVKLSCSFEGAPMIVSDWSFIKYSSGPQKNAILSLPAVAVATYDGCTRYAYRNKLIFSVSPFFYGVRYTCSVFYESRVLSYADFIIYATTFASSRNGGESAVYLHSLNCVTIFAFITMLTCH
ncbi:hypothetical protein BgiMline_036738 [Biomphalaria glabrata]|nr:hypothetical protein BgiMline_015176 [Biomphalaria glabrata]